MQKHHYMSMLNSNIHTHVCMEEVWVKLAGRNLEVTCGRRGRAFLSGLAFITKETRRNEREQKIVTRAILSFSPSFLPFLPKLCLHHSRYLYACVCKYVETES